MCRKLVFHHNLQQNIKTNVIPGFMYIYDLKNYLATIWKNIQSTLEYHCLVVFPALQSTFSLHDMNLLLYSDSDFIHILSIYFGVVAGCSFLPCLPLQQLTNDLVLSVCAGECYANKCFKFAGLEIHAFFNDHDPNILKAQTWIKFANDCFLDIID